MKEEIVMQTEQALNPLQFAYRAHRGVNDATITLLNLPYKHLEGSNTHARLLFIDFSSAFKTIQPHILAMRLLEHFKLSNNLVGWILAFLTNRTQMVKVNGILSDLLCLSTGSPQGCVLSPLLYILSKHPNSTILKFADDTVIVSLLHNNESGRGPVIEEFVTWCDESYLELNLIKTKDKILDLVFDVMTLRS